MNYKVYESSNKGTEAIASFKYLTDAQRFKRVTSELYIDCDPDPKDSKSFYIGEITEIRHESE